MRTLTAKAGRIRRSAWIIASLISVSGCAHPRSAYSPAINSTTRLHVAEAAEQAGDYTLATSMYAAASKAAPTDGGVQLRFADFLVRRGQYAAAHDLLQSDLKAVDDPRPLRRGLAAIDTLRGDPARALAEYDLLARSDPGNARLVVDKAVTLDLLGRHADAQALYRQVLQAHPQDLVCLNDLALSLALSGRKSAAQALIAPISGRDDLRPRIRNTIGIILAANGDTGPVDDTHAAALTELAQALDHPPPAPAP